MRSCLANCGLRPASAALLAEGLASNATLRELRLDANSVGDAGATALAEALQRNRTLRILNLQLGGVGTAGAMALTINLLGNRTLRGLGLAFNPIGPAGLEALEALIEQPATLTVVHEALVFRCCRCVFIIIRLVLRVMSLAARLRAWLRWLISCRCRRRQATGVSGSGGAA